MWTLWPTNGGWIFQYFIRIMWSFFYYLQRGKWIVWKTCGAVLCLWPWWHRNKNVPNNRLISVKSAAFTPTRHNIESFWSFVICSCNVIPIFLKGKVTGDILSYSKILLKHKAKVNEEMSVNGKGDTNLIFLQNCKAESMW